MDHTNFKNKTIYLSGTCLMTLLLSSALTFAQSTRKMNLGLVYPLSTSGRQARLDTNNLSIHLIAGLSAAEDGLTVAGISNLVKKDARGLQLAGFSNHIGNYAGGMQIAGFMNTYKKGKGTSLAGFSNISGEIKGLQFAGFLNLTGELDGAQFAGFANIAKNSKGVQIAGFINTARNVRSQFAGFINVAKNVEGVQAAGFINIAESSNYPIGIINIIRNGEKWAGTSIDETGTAMLNFRSGGKVLYGIIGVGYNLKNKDEVYALEAGLGAHFFPSGNFRINVEANMQVLESFKSGEYFKSSLKFLPGLHLGRVEIFAGPTFNYINTNTMEGRTLQNHYIKTWGSQDSRSFNALYIGYTAGVQVAI
jgi:hypothetical protein